MLYGYPAIEQNDAIFEARLSAAQAIVALPTTNVIAWRNIIRNDPKFINYEPVAPLYRFYLLPGFYRIVMSVLFDWSSGNRWGRIGITRIDGVTLYGQGQDVTSAPQLTCSYDKLIYVRSDIWFTAIAQTNVNGSLNASVANIKIFPVWIPLPDYQFDTNVDL